MNDPIEVIKQENLDVYRASPGRLQEDVSQEAQVAHDYRGRLVYELLQNADDAMEASEGQHDRILFHVTDDALWVANTGRPFTDRDVYGLCGLGASSKVDAGGTRRASIGHKGLGFKSVLEITDTPMALSTSYSFELGEAHANAAVLPMFEQLGRPAPKRLPAMRFPAPVAEPPARWADLRTEGYNAAFVFPFAEHVDATGRAQLADLLLDLPVTTVVFLKHLEEVTVRVDQSGRSEAMTWRASRTRHAEGAWEPTPGLDTAGVYRITVEGAGQEPAQFLLAHDDDVRIGDHREGLSGPAWDGVDVSEVSVATLDPERHDQPMAEAWRHFHVFLPTAEPSPYPFLVNGAFTTDLSRQQVRIGASARDYNGHLVRAAASLFRRELAPRLVEVGPTALLRALDLSHSPAEGSAAELLHTEMRATLADLAFVPAGETALSFPDTLVPPTELGDVGGRLAELTRVGASVEGARLPDPAFCVEPYTTVAAAHGARRLAATEALELLANHISTGRDGLVFHDSGGFMLDPVVELAAELWSNAEPDLREQIEALAKKLPLFPVHADAYGVRRIALDGRAAFYPPQSARQDLPLEGLAFMLHDVCWGALYPNERKSQLDERMTVWRALFDVSEFRFEEVMRAAVLPALVRNPEGDALALREQLQDMDALAAICQLAGKQPKPDRPLRYQRLQSDRALFNLSRLPVPCVHDGQETWLPAYRVYFGRDWFPEGSVEDITEALNDPAKLDLPLLTSPDQFLGLLDQYETADGDAESDEPGAEGVTDEDDEVGLEEDLDQPVETNERARWVDFLSWLGVNRCLRPVHFYDVEDAPSGWLTTKHLEQPQGWAFQDLTTTWSTFADALRQRLDGHPTSVGTIPYLYECHDIEGLGVLVEQAEQDESASIARAVFRHLALHWDTYQRFSNVEVALVGENKWPNARTKPQRAMPDERHELGDNLWVHRLRRSGVCPTTHGPRRPERAWLSGPEVKRRFSRRRGLPAGEILPVVELGDDLPGRSARGLADRLGVRLDLSPSAFTIDDAELVCRRLGEVYGADGRHISDEALRYTIRPSYREVFELLSGTAPRSAMLTNVLMLAEVPEGWRFLPAESVLYARNPGTKDRSGVGSRVPTFVLEAEPAATRPLTAIFGMRTLEEALRWEPDPGDPTFDAEELERFRDELRHLTPALLARLRVERARAGAEDLKAMLDFVERVEPVTELSVACFLGDEVVTEREPRTYFVSSPAKEEAFQAFILWDGDPWPPSPDEQQALAMSLADALGVNLVETFLAFIDGDDARRHRLLSLAGATAFLDEIQAELAGPLEPDDQVVDPAPEGLKTKAPDAGHDGEPTVGATPTPAPAAPGASKIPLVSLDDFAIAGEIELVAGEEISEPAGSSGSDSGGGARSTRPTRRRRAAPGTDLSELDQLGMLITMGYELRRLRSGGKAPVVLSDVETTDTLVVDVSTPTAIARARDASAVFKSVYEHLRQQGVSELHPGFDILTIVDGGLDRAIELKSSGVDARVQAMSWNEWKSAGSSELRGRFWLYLVGNLRADLPADPYVRAIHDPFGTLMGDETTASSVRRAIQLRVHEFDQAEQLVLRPRDRAEVL